ncbi:MAG: hypothetical protein AAF267_11870 [Deinococcota bacterium]
MDNNDSDFGFEDEDFSLEGAQEAPTVEYKRPWLSEHWPDIVTMLAWIAIVAGAALTVLNGGDLTPVFLR